MSQAGSKLSQADGAGSVQNTRYASKRASHPHLYKSLTSSERTIFCRGRTAQEREKNRPIASIGGSRDRPNATMSIQPKT
jgi:hypothetical protein